MSRKLIAMFGIVVCMTILPLSVWAETQTITPPSEKGFIWIVIRHKKSYPPMNTNVSIQWGRWSKKESINAAGFRYSYEGVVIRLRHSKNDSVPITVSTDGSILKFYQGNEPSQWSSKTWDKKNW